MQLVGWTPPAAADGDRLQCQDLARMTPPPPLVVRVNEYRTGITTQYSPDGGGSGVTVDVVNLLTGQIYIDVLWMTAAVRDGLKDHVGRTFPIRLQYMASKAGNSYVGIVPLEGQELALAQQWAATNGEAFERERVRRQIEGNSGHAAQVPGAPAQPPPWATGTAPAAATADPPTVPNLTPLVPAAAAPAATPAAPAAAPAATGNPLDNPAVQALLAQWQQQGQ